VPAAGGAFVATLEKLTGCDLTGGLPGRPWKHSLQQVALCPPISGWVFESFSRRNPQFLISARGEPTLEGFVPDSESETSIPNLYLTEWRRFKNMSFKKEMMDEIRDGKGLRPANGNDGPSVEVWPEHDYADLVSAHSDRVGNIIRHTAEFRAGPYYGAGYDQQTHDPEMLR
jgi:hypothetical protein